MAKSITKTASAEILKDRLMGKSESCAGARGLAILGTSASRTVAGSCPRTVMTVSASGVAGMQGACTRCRARVGRVSRSSVSPCFRVSVPRSVRGTRFRNQLLTELHSDQVNIVQLPDGSARRTMLFTKGSEPAALP